MKNNLVLCFLSGVIVGVCVFISIYGFNVLNVTNISWLYNKGDLMQHQIGWQAFRMSKWYFPLRLHDGLTFPYKISVVYTDSIPLFVIIFKCFSSVLPSQFQYIGIFGLLSFALQGGFGAILVHRFIKNIFICCSASVLFLCNHVIIYRMFAHTALASQWIILAALALWIYNSDINDKKMLIFWSALLALASALHMYFVPMLGVMLFFFCLMKFKEKGNIKRTFVLFLVPCLLSVLVMFLLGVFYGGVVIGINDIFIYTMNINSFINPIPIGHSGRVSLLLKPLPVDFGQYEGGCYLGLGVIAFLIVIIFVNLIIRLKNKNNHIPYQYAHPLRFYLMLMVLVFYILSLGTTVKLGTIPITNIWYPGVVIKLLGIFRSLGRFIWPVYYLMFLYVIVKISEFSKKKKILICLVSAVVSVNVMDQILMLTDYHNYYREVSYKIYEQDEKWNKIFNKHAVLCGSVNSDFA